MKIEYTPAQEQAIYTRDKSLLLSAAAGSGKTAVLVARILDIISNEDNDVNITDLLIVTFTNLAAAQMKEKIYKELSARIKESPENKKLKKQMLYLSSAKIKTIHSFCLDLIKENIDCLDIPVGFRIADENEEKAVKSKVIGEFIEDMYKQEDSDFYDIINTYAYGRDDNNFINLITDLDKLIESIEDKKSFFENCMVNLQKASENFTESIFAELMVTHIKRFLKASIKKYDALIEQAELSPDFEQYSPFFREEKAVFEQLYQIEDYNSLKEKFLSYTFPPIVRKKQGTDSAIFTDTRNSVKDTYQKKLAAMLRISEETEKQNQKEISGHFKNLVSLYFKFEKALEKEKRRKNIFFFRDFERYALKLLKNKDGTPSKLAENLKENFYEILIDEYQDTSAQQNSIFEIISKSEKNFFMVGDVKQSIYKFRNAKPELFIDRAKKYKNDGENSELILLNKNFRSRRQIIDSTNSVFEKIMTVETSMTDYTQEKLVYGAKLPEAEGCDYKTEVLLFQGKKSNSEEEDSSNEGNMIAQRIKKLFSENFKIYDSKKEIHRPIQYSDIVILTRDRGEVSYLIYSSLVENNIPVISEFEAEFYQRPEIMTVTGILKAIDNPYDDLALLTMLKSPSLHFSETELLEIRFCDEYGPFFDALKKCDTEKAIKTVSILKSFSQKAAVMKVSQLIAELYDVLKIYEHISSLDDYEQKIFHLDLLYKTACNFEKTNSGTLKNFLYYIKHNKPQFQNVKNSNAVKMLTIHKSKGLEFPVVFVAGTCKSLSLNVKDKKILTYSDSLIGMDYISAKDLYATPTLCRKIVKNAIDYESISEQLRLLYVAMTRAKEKLIITANIRNSNIARWKLIRESGGHSLYTLFESMCFIDWIMPIAETSAFFKIDIKEEISVTDAEITDTQQSEKPKESFEIDEAVFYEYPDKERTKLPLKVTVSYANRLSKDNGENSAIYFSVDDLDTTDDKCSGSEYGTYFHKMFELCDISEIKKGENVKNVINKLFENQLIEYTEYSDDAISGIEAFFETPLGKELLESDTVKKETPFLVKINADEIFEGSCKDEILLQGATDCYFEKDGKIVLLDFKTDKNPDEEKIRKNYTKQIELYSYALEKVTGMKVAKKVIYTVRNSKIIEI